MCFYVRQARPTRYCDVAPGERSMRCRSAVVSVDVPRDLPQRAPGFEVVADTHARGGIIILDVRLAAHTLLSARRWLLARTLFWQCLNGGEWHNGRLLVRTRRPFPP